MTNDRPITEMSLDDLVKAIFTETPPEKAYAFERELALRCIRAQEAAVQSALTYHTDFA